LFREPFFECSGTYFRTRNRNKPTKNFITGLGISLDSGFYEIEPRPKSTLSYQALPQIWLLGLSNKRLVTLGQKALILNFCGLNQGTVLSYRRIFVNSVLVNGSTYLREQRRNNSVVAFHPDGNQGEIAFLYSRSFHEVTSELNGGIRVVVLGRLLHKVNGDFVRLREDTTAEEGDLDMLNYKYQEVHPVAANQALLVVDARWITSVCCYVLNSFSNRVYTIQRKSLAFVVDHD